MRAAMRGFLVVGTAMLCSGLPVSGCSTISKMEQDHRAANLHRQQVAEAAAANEQPKSEQDKKAKKTQDEARLRKVQTALIVRGDADSLAAAALLGRVVTVAGGPGPIDLATRAFTAAPSRPDILFVLLQLCEADKGCDPRVVEERLRVLDPDNGVTWTYALARADLAADGQARATSREGLSRSKRVDWYWNSIISHLAAAAGRAGLSTGDAMISFIGIEAAYVNPLQPVSKACSAPDIEQLEVLDQCRRIADAFRRGDTTLFEIYGSGLASRLWPEGSAEGREIAAERLAQHYRTDLMSRNSAKLNSPQATRSLVTYLSRYPTEQTAFRALYAEFGLNPDPPPGWTDAAKTGG